MRAGYSTASKVLENTEAKIIQKGKKLIPSISQFSLSMDEESIYAECQGYEVVVDLDECQCQCRYFETHGRPCQHIAACALKVTGDDWIAESEPTNPIKNHLSQSAKSFAEKITSGGKKNPDLSQLFTQGRMSTQIKTGLDFIENLPELYFALRFQSDVASKSIILEPVLAPFKHPSQERDQRLWWIEVYGDEELTQKLKTTQLIESYDWPESQKQVLRFIQKAFELKHWSSHVADKISALYRYFEHFYRDNGSAEIDKVQLNPSKVTHKLVIKQQGDNLICTPQFWLNAKRMDLKEAPHLISDTTHAIMIDHDIFPLESPIMEAEVLKGFIEEFIVGELDREAFLWKVKDLDTSYVKIPDSLLPKEVTVTPKATLLLRMSQLGLEMSLGFVYHPDHFRISFQNSTAEALFFEEGRFHHVVRNNSIEGELKSQIEEVIKSKFNLKESRQILREAWYGEYYILRDGLENFVTNVFPELDFVEFENEKALDPWRIIQPEIDLQLGSGIDWFEVNGKVTFGDFQLSLMDLLKKMYVQDKATYVDLEDGSKGLVPQELISLIERINGMAVVNHSSMLKNDLNDLDDLKEGLRVSKYQSSLIQELYDLECVLVQDRQAWKNQLKSMAMTVIDKANVPETIQAKLRSYQEDGLHWLRTMHIWGTGGILADDMGLGKTLQVITLLETTRAIRQGPVLIVLPTSLLFNWQREFDKFAPHFQIYQYYGAKRANVFKKLVEKIGDYKKQHLESNSMKFNHSIELDLFSSKITFGSDIYLTSYQVMQRDAEKLMGIEFDYLILDESQAIKNPTTKTHKAARLLKAKHRLAMTGTPVENNLLDLWSQFDFLMPGFLGKKKFFQDHFQRPIQDKKNKERSESLKALVDPFYLRRTKEVVLKDLPQKQDLVIWVNMGESQQKLYDQTRDKYRQELMDQLESEGADRTRIDVLQGLLRLRQIACDPRLMDPNSKVPSAKMQLLIDKLEKDVMENHKALVFSQFTSLLKLAGSELERRGLAYSYLDGRTRDREGAIQSFIDDPERKIFLISLKAGGVGLNLTQADYVFHLDPWWNPAAEEQATARAHRMGQENTVMNYKLITAGTVEEKILELQNQKKNLADEILSADVGVVKELTPDLIERLFGGVTTSSF